MARVKLQKLPDTVVETTEKIYSSVTGKELDYNAQEYNEGVKTTGIHNTKLRRLLKNDTIIDVENVPVFDPDSEHIPKIADPVVYDTIVTLVRDGNYVSTVAGYAGIDPTTFYNYLERGKNGYNDLYRKFYLDVQKAWSEAEMNLLKKLRAHADIDWRVSAWQLERMFPERYSLKTVNRTEVNVTGEIQHKMKNEFAESIAESIEKRELVRKLLE